MAPDSGAPPRPSRKSGRQNGGACRDEVFFRILLFKLFNRVETWELLEKNLGQLTWEGYSFRRYDRILTGAMARGLRIYSAAYIMPSAGTLGHDKKHRNHLALVERMMADELPRRLAEAPSMQRAFQLLHDYPSVGDFLAYQFVTDVKCAGGFVWTGAHRRITGRHVSLRSSASSAVSYSTCSGEMLSRERALVSGPNRVMSPATPRKAAMSRPKAAGRLVAIRPGMTRLVPIMLARLQA